MKFSSCLMQPLLLSFRSNVKYCSKSVRFYQSCLCLLCASFLDPWALSSSSQVRFLLGETRGAWIGKHKLNSFVLKTCVRIGSG